MFAEWGDSRAAYDGPDAVAALAGATPVTKASGRQHAVRFRSACNKRFRQAITTFADNSRHEKPLGRPRLHPSPLPRTRPPHAIRIPARAWVRVIYRCWSTGQPYDPDLHRGAKNIPSRPEVDSGSVIGPPR